MTDLIQGPAAIERRQRLNAKVMKLASGRVKTNRPRLAQPFDKAHFAREIPRKSKLESGAIRTTTREFQPLARQSKHNHTVLNRRPGAGWRVGVDFGLLAHWHKDTINGRLTARRVDIVFIEYPHISIFTWQCGCFSYRFSIPIDDHIILVPGGGMDIRYVKPMHVRWSTAGLFDPVWNLFAVSPSVMGLSKTRTKRYHGEQRKQSQS
jgi:hypothetical protein